MTAIEQALGFGFLEIDDFRHQKPLPLYAGLGQHGLHALIDQPLMRRVLVDNDDTVRSLGDDIGLVHLRPGRTERPVRCRGLGQFTSAMGVV